MDKVFGLLSFFVSTLAFAAVPVAPVAPVAHVLRLKPGQDVLLELRKFAHERALEAASLSTAVGSLNQAALRFANQEKATVLKGPFEIVSLMGTLSKSGEHLHLSVSDSSGKTVGGHLMPGSLIYTTLEIAILEYPGLEFTREVDPTYGYKELTIKKR